jgi:peptidoglycan/xylan/chitin deacetylase (PgdA/CDA1 family)
MLAKLLAGLAGLALLALPAVAQTKCAPGAIGTARVIELDATGGPRLGHLQYPGPQLLEPKEVVLTFDDGPHKQLTPVILDILDAHCAKATFFMVGQRALMYPAIVRDVARRGHTIATHTWAHRNLGQTGPEAGIAEIELGISAVQRALGEPAAPFFRFPYLSDPGYAQQHLRRRNTAMFSIDVDSQDFRTRSPTVVLRNISKGLQAKGRGILLFHDIQPSTAGALGALLADLKANGYRIVHVVPRAPQVTVAEYDRRAGSQPLGSVAPSSLPVQRRVAVNPAWEPRVVPLAGERSAQLPAAVQVAAPAPPPPAFVPRPRREADSDWRTTIFRGY